MARGVEDFGRAGRLHGFERNKVVTVGCRRDDREYREYAAEDGQLEREQRVRAANDQSIVVRVGWQMALRRGGNNMVEHLAHNQAELGHIDASTEWFPACSF